MIGGVIGDYVGSVFEDSTFKTFNLTPLISRKSHITDDTVMLCATAEALMTNNDFESSYRKWAAKYPDFKYGIGTKIWLASTRQKGYSYGNGAASRAGVIGFLDINEPEILGLAKQSAECSHSHPEAIDAAQAIALSIYLLRKGHNIDFVEAALYEAFDYIFLYDMLELNRHYELDCSAVTSVPLAIYIGLKGKSYEDIIRTCLYVGGDTDTLMCMAGLIGEVRFGVCEKLKIQTERYLFRHANDLLFVCNAFDRFVRKGASI